MTRYDTRIILRKDAVISVDVLSSALLSFSRASARSVKLSDSGPLAQYQNLSANNVSESTTHRLEVNGVFFFIILQIYISLGIIG